MEYIELFLMQIGTATFMYFLLVIIDSIVNKIKERKKLKENIKQLVEIINRQCEDIEKLLNNK